MLDAAFVLLIDEIILRLFAGAIIEYQQVKRQAGVFAGTVQADLQHIQRFGVEAAQEGDVIQDRHGDSLGLDNCFHVLRGVLSDSHALSLSV